MNNFFFTPEENDQSTAVPFFEDARSDYAPYYSSSKTVNEAKAETVNEFGKLGAGVTSFKPGWFGDKPRRYGYEIRFMYRGVAGLIRVAGLPIKAKATERKIEQVRTQALLNVRDWLKASVTQPVFSPGGEPLLQYLLVDGQRTMYEYMLESFSQLALADTAVVDGEFTE